MENTSNFPVQDYSDYIFGKSFYLTWAQTIPLVLLTSVTLVANGAVLLMFVVTKSLRRCRNIYIASLALADFLIGCTMPVSMLENVKPPWAPQGAWCQLHLIARHSLLYVSLLSILLISVDRWWSINYPFSYRVRQSRRLAVCAVTVSWVLSFALHIPPMVIWNDVQKESNRNNSSSLGMKPCDAPYRKNFLYLLVTSVVEYLCPLIALWILNCSIYFRISRRKSIKIRRSMSVTDTLYLGYRKSSSESEGNNYGSDENSDLCPQLSNGRRTSYVYKSSRRHSLTNCMNGKNILMQYPRTTPSSRRVSFDISMSGIPYNNKRPISRKCSLSSIIGKNSVVRKQSDDLVRDLLVKQDKKAACSLGMMVIVFTVCWTPHMVAEVINSRCIQCLPETFITITFWILVANSAINPFLYGLLNAEFRKVLKQWLYCNSTRKFRIKEAVMYWNIMPMNTDMIRENDITCVNALKEWPS
ncbi:muscarinic acetylcholine receptor M5-like [Patella vulgata]|uniref:muscarinic acetylcholine receptor M5-like n=1 Tax=Patella vulgata TaxID=6465 RepID=UPI0021802D62|nr:muscarinic acetylcholine receptor M5-like [Patella vulgata]